MEFLDAVSFKNPSVVQALFLSISALERPKIQLSWRYVLVETVRKFK